MLLTINNKNAYVRVTPPSGWGATRIRNQLNENFDVLMIKTKWVTSHVSSWRHIYKGGKGVGCKLVNNINYSSRIFPDHISLGQNSKRYYMIDCRDKGNNLKPWASFQQIGSFTFSTLSLCL